MSTYERQMREECGMYNYTPRKRTMYIDNIGAHINNPQSRIQPRKY